MARTKIVKASSSATPSTSSSAKKRKKAQDADSSASAAVADPSPTPKKRAKKEAPERRLARYSASPSKAIRERIERAFKHRLYLIDQKPIGNVEAPSACDFYVLGATGNVYIVKIDKRPSCTCPDAAKGNICKHLLFVYLRVLKLDKNDPRSWQKALLSSELEDLLHMSVVNEAVLASQRVRERFKAIGVKSDTGEEEVDNKGVQRKVEGDCPVCYEAMATESGKISEPVVFCKVCGNNVHKDCFERWSRSKGSGSVTCIYCRAVWDSGKKSGEKGEGSYVNLAAYSEAHANEDTTLEALYPETHNWIGRGR